MKFRKFINMLSVGLLMLSFFINVPSVMAADPGNLTYKFTSSDYTTMQACITMESSVLWEKQCNESGFGTLRYLGEGTGADFEGDIWGDGKYKLFLTEGDISLKTLVRIGIDTFNDYKGIEKEMMAETYHVENGWFFGLGASYTPGTPGDTDGWASLVFPPQNTNSLEAYWIYGSNVSESNPPKIKIDYYGNYKYESLNKFVYENGASVGLIGGDIKSVYISLNTPIAWATHPYPTEGGLHFVYTDGTDLLIKSVKLTDNNGGTGPPASGKVNVRGNVYVEVDGNKIAFNIKGSIGTNIEIDFNLSTADGSYAQTVRMDSQGTYQADVPVQKEITVKVDHKIDTELFDFLDFIYGSLDEKFSSGYLKGTTTFTAGNTGLVTAGEEDIVLNMTQVNAADDVIKNALIPVVEGIDTAKGAVREWINNILVKGNDIGSDMENPGLVNAWNQVRNLALSLITLAILIIAFMNILSIDLEKYGINRMIPRLILGVGYTYLSFIIAKFLLEMASAFQSRLLSGTGISNTMGTGYTLAGIASSLEIGQLIFLIILGVVTILAMLWLCILLYVRIFVIWFLVAVAPIAFILYVMPFTQSLFMKWWSVWWKWLFMGPIVAFLLWLGEIFISSAGVAGGSTSITASESSWNLLILSAVSIFLAASIPMALGGNVYSALKNAAQKAGKMSKYVPGVGKAQRAIKNRLDLRRGARDQREQLAAKQAQAKWANVNQGKGVRGWMGRRVAGINKKQAAQLKDNLLDQMVKDRGLGTEDEGVLKKNLSSQDANLAMASARVLKDRGRLGSVIDNENAASVAKLVREDSGLRNSLFKENKDVFHALENRGHVIASSPGGPGYAGLTAYTSKPLDWKAESIKYLSKQGPQGVDHIFNQVGGKDTMDNFMRNGDNGAKEALGQLLMDTTNGLAKKLEAKGVSKADINTLQQSAVSSWERSNPDASKRKRPLDVK